MALGLVLIAVVIALLQGRSRKTAERSAAPVEISGCAKRVVDDWYVDGHFDDAYAPRCYADALTALEAVRARDPLADLGNAQEAIRQARPAKAP